MVTCGSVSDPPRNFACIKELAKVFFQKLVVRLLLPCPSKERLASGAVDTDARSCGERRVL